MVLVVIMVVCVGRHYFIMDAVDNTVEVRKKDAVAINISTVVNYARITSFDIDDVHDVEGKEKNGMDNVVGNVFISRPIIFDIKGVVSNGLYNVIYDKVQGIMDY